MEVTVPTPQRAHTPAAKRLLIFDNGTWIDIGAATVHRRDGDEARLRPTVLDCLKALVAAKGDFVSTQALRRTYGIGDPAHTIHTLRSAVADDPRRPRYIVTARVLGYRLSHCVLRVYSPKEDEDCTFE
jgi:DNA-binding response OmpR family regulator